MQRCAFVRMFAIAPSAASASGSKQRNPVARSQRHRQLVVVFIALACLPAWAGICRVTPGGGGQFNDGSNWTVPVKLSQALVASTTCTEIWVAKGLYKPTTALDNTISFNVKPGVAVYGGFAGSETLRTQRDPVVNLTVLSGDIDNNDGSNANGVDVDTTHILGSNSYHVVTMLGGAGSNAIIVSTVLDGFTITGGYANGSAITDQLGGGLKCDGASSSGSECSPMLSHLVFSGNRAALGGGGMISFGRSGGISSPTLDNVTFSGNRAGLGGALYNTGTNFGTSNPAISNATFIGNTADASGGAIFNSGADSGTSNPTLSKVTFSGNQAGNGGAIFNSGSAGTCLPTISNATFRSNSVSSDGGAIYDDVSSPTLTNVTFSGNQASGHGGAIASIGTGQPTLLNAILWGDLAPLGQGAEVFFDAAAAPMFDHSIVRGSGGSIAWNVAFGVDIGSNLDIDPELGALADNGGATRTMLPGAASPAIDAGSDGGCPTTDQRGLPRIVGAHCDIGAVERQNPEDLIFRNGFDSP